jgi:hypothetical protein
MSQYAKKIFSKLLLSIVVAIVGLANWRWPLYLFFGDTQINRFIWMGIFFVLLDILIEIILGMKKELQLIIDSLNLSRDVRKLSDSFRLISKYSLPNGLKADYIIVGSSGVWLIVVKDDMGKLSFDGDELSQDEIILRGLLTQSLERAFALSNLLKQKLNRTFIVTPVIAFSSPRADLGSIPKIVRGVYLSSRKDVVSVIENTDVQLIDKNTTEEIFKLLQ